jgi:hypothetical protein
MWQLHKLMNNLATKEVHLVSIWQSSMCKIYWAKKKTLGNLCTCSFHHVTTLKAFTLKTTMQQNTKNLDMSKTPLAFEAKIRTFKKVAYNKICKLWCIDVSNRVQKLHNFNQQRDHGLLININNNESNFVLIHKLCDTLQCFISRVKHESKHVMSFAILKCVNRRKKWFQNKISNFESKSLHFK